MRFLTARLLSNTHTLCGKKHLLKDFLKPHVNHIYDKFDNEEHSIQELIARLTIAPPQVIDMLKGQLGKISLDRSPIEDKYQHDSFNTLSIDEQNKINDIIATRKVCNKLLFEFHGIEETPTFIKHLDANWDILHQLVDFGTSRNSVLLSAAFIQLIEKRWDWFMKHDAILWGEICQVEEPWAVDFIGRHFDTFIYYCTDRERQMEEFLKPKSTTKKRKGGAAAAVPPRIPNKHHMFRLYENKAATPIIQAQWDFIIANKLLPAKYSMHSRSDFAVALTTEQWRWLLENKHVSGIKDLFSHPSAIPLIVEQFEAIKADKKIKKSDYYSLIANKSAIDLIDTHWTWFWSNKIFKEYFNCPMRYGHLLPLVEKYWGVMSADKKFMKDNIHHLFDYDMKDALPIIEVHWDELLPIIDADTIDCIGNKRDYLDRILSMRGNVAAFFIAHFDYIMGKSTVDSDGKNNYIMTLYNNRAFMPFINDHWELLKSHGFLTYAYIKDLYINPEFMPVVEHHFDELLAAGNINWYSLQKNPGIFNAVTTPTAV